MFHSAGPGLAGRSPGFRISGNLWFRVMIPCPGVVFFPGSTAPHPPRFYITGTGKIVAADPAVHAAGCDQLGVVDHRYFTFLPGGVIRRNIKTGCAEFLQPAAASSPP